MICSDGLWDVVPEPQLKEILATQPPDQAVKTYIDRTLRNGAPDNVTVIIASTRSVKPKRKWWPFALVGVLAIAAAAALLAADAAVEHLALDLVVGHAVSIAVRGRVNRPLAGRLQQPPAKAGSRP